MSSSSSSQIESELEETKQEIEAPKVPEKKPRSSKFNFRNYRKNKGKPNILELDMTEIKEEEQVSQSEAPEIFD
jgi:hypothetical protein